MLRIFPPNNEIRLAVTVTPTAGDTTPASVQRVNDRSLTVFYDGAQGTTPVTDAAGALRLVRQGDTWTGYTMRNGAWVELHSGPGPIGDVILTLDAWGHDSLFSHQPVEIGFDNLVLNQGQISCPPPDPTTSVHHLIDGSLAAGWQSSQPDDTYVVLGFANDTIDRLTGVMVDPAPVGGDGPAAEIKDFRVLVSDTGAEEANFHEVLTAATARKAEMQLFHFPNPVSARYLKLVALSNYGDPAHVDIAELGVLASAAAAGTHLRPHVLPAGHTAVAHVRAIRRGLSVSAPPRPQGRGHVRQPLYTSNGLVTGKGQRASIGFQDGTVLHMNQRTDLVLASPHLTYLGHGGVDEILQPGTRHMVQTAAATASAIGTEYVVRMSGKTTIIRVVEGGRSRPFHDRSSGPGEDGSADRGARRQESDTSAPLRHAGVAHLDAGSAQSPSRSKHRSRCQRRPHRVVV